MAHVIEAAASGRSKCRGCGERIAKGELRFGERLPNPFAEGEMTHWYHVRCGAYRRPQSFKELLDAGADPVAEALTDVDTLAAAVALGLAHRRVERINGLERAPSGRARCRACREAIAKGAWRIPLVFFEEGMFNAAGFVHVACAARYFETTDILDRLLHFGGALDDAALAEVRGQLGTGTAAS